MRTKIYIGGFIHRYDCLKVSEVKPIYQLESYWYLKNETPKIKEAIEWWKQSDSIMLDSGAFTFMSAKKNGRLSKKMEGIDIYEYAKNYAEFIKKHDIDLFMELDVDDIYSYDTVLELRNIIETHTGKKCIPVWHESRGAEEWYKMCDNYDYIAIGGIARKQAKHDLVKKLTEMCEYAHNKNVLVHGLGFTRQSLLNNRVCPFDSVDSTSWTGTTGMRYKLDPVNGLTNEKQSEMYWKTRSRLNYEEWCKYTRWCEE